MDNFTLANNAYNIALEANKDVLNDINKIIIAHSSLGKTYCTVEILPETGNIIKRFLKSKGYSVEFHGSDYIGFSWTEKE